MNTVPIDTAVLTTLLGMAQSHVEDVRSGLVEGLYQQADNQDLPAKEGAIAAAHLLLNPLSADQQALLKILTHLHNAGWQPTYQDDGGDEIVRTEGKGLEEIVREASTTAEAGIGFIRTDGRGLFFTGSILLVWGNDPSGIDLIADHSTAAGFGEAVDAAQRSVWPNYPED